MAPNREVAQRAKIAAVDPIWAELRREAEDVRAQRAGPRRLHLCDHPEQGAARGCRLPPPGAAAQPFRRRCRPDRRNLRAGAAEHPELGRAFRADLAAVYDRDPACSRYIEPLLYFKGFHALVTHRFAHELLKQGRRDFALYLQSQSSRIFAVDINPAARIGIGIMLDHGTGIVIGETAAIGDNCSILQGVTLGGTGKETGDRHPKIGDNVLIGAGAKVLGNIKVGDCSPHRRGQRGAEGRAAARRRWRAFRPRWSVPPAARSPRAPWISGLRPTIAAAAVGRTHVEPARNGARADLSAQSVRHQDAVGARAAEDQGLGGSLRWRRVRRHADQRRRGRRALLPVPDGDPGAGPRET